MTKLNTVKRKASVGERVLITNRDLGSIKNGDIGEVISADDLGVDAFIRDKPRPAYHEEYEVIIENKTEASEMVKSLKEIVSSLRDCGYICEAGPLENNVDFQMLEQIAGSNDYLAVNHDGSEIPVGKGVEVWKREVYKSPQQIRDDITEQAKRDVAELAEDFYGQWKYRFDGNYMCDADFVVNSDKRTVVAMIRHRVRGRREFTQMSRGIAKCAPTDCFNAHIGKAITLRRALGLEVPAKYMSVPQPTEVRVGDVVELTAYPKEGQRRVVRSLENYGNVCRFTTGTLASKKYVKVIDDTRADAEHEVAE